MAVYCFLVPYSLGGFATKKLVLKFNLRMTQDSDLFGAIPPPKPTDRLFFALFPSEEAIPQIVKTSQNLRDVHGLTGKSISNDRLHVTLHHVGDYAGGLPDGLVETVQEVASKIEMSAFDVTFDRAMSFAGSPRNKPFVLRGNEGRAGGLADLMAFQKSFYLAMCRVGLQGPRANTKFAPHVTLMYDPVGVAEQTVEPIRWTAQDFVLVHSLLGQTKHIHLGRWPVQA
jgi:RNA 2',3'-cyclic 3'-phosphodiesterase